MLPHAPDIGISETFGTESIGTLDVRADDKISMEFNLSTVYSGIERRITYINSSSRTIWDPSFGDSYNLDPSKQKKSAREESGNAASFDDLALGDICLTGKAKYVNKQKAQKLKTSLKQNGEDEIFGSFDPTKGETSSAFKMKSNTFLMVASGAKNNVLLCGMLDPLWKGWKLSKIRPDTNDEKSAKKIDALFNKVRNLRAPKFILLRKLTFNSSIKQLETHNIGIKGDAQLILVRTTDSVHILRCTYSESRAEFGLTKVFSFSKGELWADFAHISMHLEDKWARIVIIDCAGKFKMFRSRIEGSTVMKFEEIDLKFKSYHDPVDLSNFKKSVWISNTRLILYSRLQLHEYRLPSDDFLNSMEINKLEDMFLGKSNQKFFCRISAGIWTRILDIKVSGSTHSMIYMLTTKEVILIDVSNGFKRMFAWKHFLNDHDTSFTLNVFKNFRTENNDFCIISSKQINFNLTLEFDTLSYKMVYPPYILPSATSILNSNFTLQYMNKSCNLIMSVQKDAGNRIFLALYNHTSIFENDTGVSSERDVDYVLSQLMDPSSAKQRAQIYQFLTEVTTVDTSVIANSEEITMQIYERIDDFLNTGDLNFGVLSEILDGVHIPKNIKNIFKIVQHLSKNANLSEIDINFIDNLWISDMFINYTSADDEEIDDPKEKARSLLLFFKSASHIEGGKEILIKLLLSLFGVWKSGDALNVKRTENELAESLTELPENYRDMIKSFEDDFDVVGIMDNDDYSSNKSNTQNDPFLSSMMSMPTVSVSNPTSRSSSAPAVSNKSVKLKHEKAEQRKSKVLLTSQTSLLSQHSQKRSLLDHSQSQLLPFSQKFSQQRKPTSSQFSQGKSTTRKKRKTGFK